MAYCAPKGIPHSVFLDWEISDQEKALAWQILEAKTCPGCGTDPDEWMDEDGVPLDEPPYEVATQICRGCQVRSGRRESMPDKSSNWTNIHFVKPGSMMRRVNEDSYLDEAEYYEEF